MQNKLASLPVFIANFCPRGPHEKSRGGAYRKDNEPEMPPIHMRTRTSSRRHKVGLKSHLPSALGVKGPWVHASHDNTKCFPKALPVIRQHPVMQAWSNGGSDS
jgi:hypothetical protein